MRNTNAFESVFFNNPSFGVKRRNNQMFRTIGCDYCFWTVHFRNRLVLYYLGRVSKTPRGGGPINLATFGCQYVTPPKIAAYQMYPP